MLTDSAHSAHADGRLRFVAVLRLIDPAIDRGDVSYFLSRVDVVPGPEPTMPRWRKRLFVATSHIAADAASYFSLPLDRTAIVGTRIEL